MSEDAVLSRYRNAYKAANGTDAPAIEKVSPGWYRILGFGARHRLKDFTMWAERLERRAATSPAPSTKEAKQQIGMTGETTAEPVAWMHPTGGWVHVDRSEISPHCLRDGTQPIPLYAAPSVAAPEEEAALPAFVSLPAETVIAGVGNLSDLIHAMELRDMSAPSALEANLKEAAEILSRERKEL